MIFEAIGDAELPPKHLQHQPMIFPESSREDTEKAPKKRAETWTHKETRNLIGLRREMEGIFNTTKSNKHLWEHISVKMREKGFDRSPTMCTDKWRNLLKEIKKARYHCKRSTKIACYKELDELLKERSMTALCNGPAPFSCKGSEEAGLRYGSIEASGWSALNLETHLDHDGQSLAIAIADAVQADEVPPWNWRDATGNGGETHCPSGGKVILVKWENYTRKIAIGGTTTALKEAIKSAFGLRSRRAF